MFCPLFKLIVQLGTHATELSVDWLFGQVITVV